MCQWSEESESVCLNVWMSEVMASEVGVCHSPFGFCGRTYQNELAIIAAGHTNANAHGAKNSSPPQNEMEDEIVHLSTRDWNLTILSTLAAFVFVISSETWKRQMNYDEWSGMTNYSGPLQMGQKQLIRRTRGTQSTKPETRECWRPKRGTSKGNLVR